MGPQVLGVRTALSAINERVAKAEAERQATRARAGQGTAPDEPGGFNSRAARAAAAVLLLVAFLFVITTLT